MALEWNYTGTSYDVSRGGSGSPVSIHWDGTFWWILEANKRVYKYNANFVLQSPTDGYNVSQTGTPKAICRAGDFWWVLYQYFALPVSHDTVYKYDLNWYYSGISIDLVSGASMSEDFFWDGTFWWLLDSYLGLSVHKFYADWNYINTYTPYPAGETYPNGIFWDGMYWWIVGSTYDRVNKYNYDWGFITVYSVDQDTYPIDILRNASGWFMLGWANKRVYLYGGDSPGTSVRILVNGVWKNVYEALGRPTLKIRKVGEVYKDVESMKVIVGGVWKNVF